MKATKVLGIVLGALLVAALFTGAAAAGDNDKYLGDVYAWALYTDGTDLKGGISFSIANNTVFTDEFGNTVTFLPETVAGTSNNYYISGDDVVAEGDYSTYVGGNKCHITVKMPSTAIAGAVYKDDAATKIGALIGSTAANDKIITVNNLTDAAIAFTNPAGDLTAIDLVNFGAAYNATLTTGGATAYTIKALDLGQWTAQAYYAKALNHKINGKAISSFAPDYILGNPYYFNIASSETSKKLEASAEEIIEGGYATITVTAPTGVWNISVENGFIPAGQPLVLGISNASGNSDFPPVEAQSETVQYWNVSVPAEGIATFSVKASTTSDIKVKLLDNDGKVMNQSATLKSVSIKVKSGTITATAVDTSVIIGNEFDIEGTNDLGGTLYFLIKGTNFPLAVVNDTATSVLTASGKVWDATIKTNLLQKKDSKKVDAGTYTIYAVSVADGQTIQNVSLDEDYLDDSKFVKAYSTVSVALKQPFITITLAPEVLVQGEKLVVKGTAEGDPKDVQYYIFGTNKFIFGSTAVTDGTYSVELSKEQTKKENMAAGQYFLVIQHPMYDKNFNIGANVTSGDVVLNKTTSWKDNSGKEQGSVLFNVFDRQSANAAQALCDNLDSQDIDDMYAKASFVVAGPTSYIDPIPSQVTKGQILTISGTTTGHVDDVVTVELLSTAFAAIPKEAVGSASFVALTTKIGADGVWSISFDTSNLNADEYTCSVAVGQLDATTAKVNIVDGAQPQPTQTGSPVTPTVKPTAQPTATPATPGFGALAALAGLGAVAVLLLRRQ